MRALLSLLSFSLIAGRVEAQNWDRYTAGSLLHIISLHDSTLRAEGSPGHPHWALSADQFPTRATLIYTGEHRPLTPEHQGILEKWQKSFQIDSAVLATFVNEYRFQEAGTDLWIPVQRQLEPPLAQEVGPGNSLTALTIFIGGYYAGGTPSWLFLLNEFQASQ